MLQRRIGLSPALFRATPTRNLIYRPLSKRGNHNFTRKPILKSRKTTEQSPLRHTARPTLRPTPRSNFRTRDRILRFLFYPILLWSAVTVVCWGSFIYLEVRYRESVPITGRDRYAGSPGFNKIIGLSLDKAAEDMHRAIDGARKAVAQHTPLNERDAELCESLAGYSIVCYLRQA